MHRLVDFFIAITAFTLFAMALTSAPREGTVYATFPSFIVFLFASFLFFYWEGNSAAHADRKANVAYVNLPPWARNVLFLGHPNPFRWRLVIYKIALFVLASIMFTLLFAIPDSIVTAIVVIAFLIVPLAFIFIFWSSLSWRDMSRQQKLDRVVNIVAALIFLYFIII